MIHKLSHILLGFILLIVLASSTIAGMQQQASTNTLMQEDIEFTFGPGSNIAEFTQISPKEMAETDGDFWYFWPNMWRFRFRAVVDIARSLIRREWFRLGIFAYKFDYHPKAHPFGPKWGPLAGARPHLQIDRYAIKFDKKGQPVGKIKDSRGEYRYREEPDSTRSWHFPWGRKVPAGKRPGRPKASSLSAADVYTEEVNFVPKDWLIGLIASEIQIREEWLRGPRPMSETTAPYEGTLPSQMLRGHLFNLVAPTRADVCRDYGGRAFGC